MYGDNKTIITFALHKVIVKTSDIVLCVLWENDRTTWIFCRIEYKKRYVKINVGYLGINFSGG